MKEQKQDEETKNKMEKQESRWRNKKQDGGTRIKMLEQKRRWYKTEK